MNTTHKLTCKEVVGLVTDYLEEALLPPVQAQMEEHLADCPDCTTYVRQIQQTIGMLRVLADGPAFPETREALLQIFQQWKRGEQAQAAPVDDSESQQ